MTIKSKHIARISAYRDAAAVIGIGLLFGLWQWGFGTLLFGLIVWLAFHALRESISWAPSFQTSIYWAASLAYGSTLLYATLAVLGGLRETDDELEEEAAEELRGRNPNPFSLEWLAYKVMLGRFYGFKANYIVIAASFISFFPIFLCIGLTAESKFFPPDTSFAQALMFSADQIAKGLLFDLMEFFDVSVSEIAFERGLNFETLITICTRMALVPAVIIAAIFVAEEKLGREAAGGELALRSRS